MVPRRLITLLHVILFQSIRTSCFSLCTNIPLCSHSRDGLHSTKNNDDTEDVVREGIGIGIDLGSEYCIVDLIIQRETLKSVSLFANHDNDSNLFRSSISQGW